MFEKKLLRKQFKELRALLKNPSKDLQIAENALREFGEFDSFFLYLSFGSEVDTKSLSQSLKERRKLVCAPRVEGDRMLSLPLTDNLSVNRFGIQEPPLSEEILCNVAFTPLLAVDREGFRLGYGGGYYDRFFSSHPQILRVGLAYFDQCVDRLPRENTDLPLHAVVTERGVNYFNHTNA